MSQQRGAVLRPQRLLSQAVADAARLAAPSGIGLDSPGVRLRMVARLRSLGLAPESVLDAFARVPRHRFVDSALAPQAYEDTSLPIGHGQTISKPSVVARMLALALQGAQAQRLGHLGRVLEIGTGCGYQAALLACLCRSLVTVERIAALHAQAKPRLEALRQELCWPHAPRTLHGDGQLVQLAGGPYDTIIAAAGGEEVPATWLQQLAVGGRLVAPTTVAGGGQVLVVIDHELRDGRSHWQRSQHEGVLFVPLKSGVV
jgi:protein-L-isoaspartate(D-aspartate) O-methyltransferase